MRSNIAKRLRAIEAKLSIGAEHWGIDWRQFTEGYTGTKTTAEARASWPADVQARFVRTHALLAEMLQDFDETE